MEKKLSLVPTEAEIDEDPIDPEDDLPIEDLQARLARSAEDVKAGRVSSVHEVIENLRRWSDERKAKRLPPH